MNWVDLALVFVMLLAIWFGWHRGFILGSLDLLTWAGSLVLGYLFYPYTVQLMDRFFDPGVWRLPVGFIITVIIARIIIGLITHYIIRAIPERHNDGAANKFLGIIPGAINGWVYAIIISALLLALPLRDSITKETRDSQLGVKLAMQSEWVNKKLAPVFDEAVRHTMNSLMVHPSSDEKVPLGFTYTNAEARPDLEMKMLEMVNHKNPHRGCQYLICQIVV